MINSRDPIGLVTRVTTVAASASERLTPRPLRPVVDRTLVDVACATSGGVTGVARTLAVDAPAVDAWRTVGIPQEFRVRLTAMTWLRPFRSVVHRPCLAA